MVSFEEIKQRVRQAKERVALQQEKRREFKEARETKRFEQQKQRIEREGEIEQRRAVVRKAQAVSRPRQEGFFQQAIGQRSGPQAPPRGVIRRKVPRKAARGRVLFDQFGRPVSVRNAPAVRRARRRRRVAPRQSPFAPSFRF